MTKYKKVSILFIVIILLFVSIGTSDDYFPMASELQNLDITDPATAGQNVTVTFQGKSAAWQTIYYAIGFSTDNTLEYTDDLVVGEGGIYNSTMADISHCVQGGKVGTQENAVPVWHDYSVDIMIPSSYSGNYYVIVIGREGYVSCCLNNNQWQDSASLMFTVASAPSVTTNATTNVEETTATLHGYLNDDDGGCCTVKFQYGTTTGYGTNTTNQSKNTGDEFSVGISSLSEGTLYHCRAVANNSNSTVYGSDVTFLTKPLVPTSFIATNYSTSQINLTWTKGTGANNTYIERNATGITTWARGAGTQIYNGTGTNYENTGLVSGTTYYYQAWSYAEHSALHQWSDSNASSSNTTIRVYDVYVDDNANPSWYNRYHVKTIQEGVNNVSVSRTIYVWAGTYNENVIANKTASLIGNSSTNTTINGGNAGSTVKITVDWVNLTGFSITNSIASGIPQKAGVRVIGNNTHIYSCNISNNNGHGVCVGVDGSDYYLNNISNSNISSNGEIGVSLLNSYNNSVYNNTVISSVNDRGIFLEGDYSVNYFNNISYNLIERSNSGIEIEGINHSIWNNTVLNNTCSGISFAEAGNVTVYNNNITSNGGYISGDNYFGLMLESSNNNTFYNNYVSNINNSITYNVYEANCNYGNVWNTTKQLGSSIIGGPYLGGNYWSDYSGHDSDNDGLGNTLIPYNSSGNISIGGDYLPLCTAQEGIVVDVSPDVWIVGNINLGEYAINNFTFWQNGTDNIDITVTINATNYTFVNWSQWQSFGHNRFCGNFTTDSWSSETTIEPGYPSTSILKSNFAPSNFTFGVRMWMPKTTTSYPSKQEDFDIVLTMQEHT